MNSVMFWVAVISLPMLYLIETLSWYVKAVASNQKIGWVVARTNILLYFSRFLFFAYSGIVYLQIETGTTGRRIYTLLIYAYCISLVAHIAVINGTISTYMASKVARLLKIPPKNSIPKTSEIDWKIAIWGSVAVAFLAAAIIAPVAFALTFPAFRLALSSLSQILNACGTMLLLIIVDPRLYAAMDHGNLPSLIRSYCIGRNIGFFIAILILLLIRDFSMIQFW